MEKDDVASTRYRLRMAGCVQASCLLALVLLLYAMPSTGFDGQPVGCASDGCLPVRPDNARLSGSKFVLIASGSRLATVRFKLADATLSRHAMRVLQPVAATLRQHADLRVSLDAHTDDAGSDVANLRLSQRRALSVASYLARLGVSSARLRPAPQGESQPMADNANATGRAQNRRVEILVLADKPFMKGSAGNAHNVTHTDVRQQATGRINE